jgi:hypothetical protein
MRGNRQVLAGPLTTKVMGVNNRFLPDSVKAAAIRVLSTPVGRR